MLSEDSENQGEIDDEDEVEALLESAGLAEVAIQDNECFAALAMQMERIESLGKIWLAAMQIGTRNDEDESLLDVLRHEMKITLQDRTYDKCVKTLALRMISRPDKNLKNSEE